MEDEMMICQREGCSREVPQGRRKYCSEECAAIVNKQSAAIRSQRYYQMTFASRKKIYTPRTCLSCGTVFKSEGPWNRICLVCAERNNGYSPLRARAVPVAAVVGVGVEEEEFEVRAER